MRHTVALNNVCSSTVSFDLEGDTVHNIEFQGGCNGNLKAVSKLSEGQTVDRLVAVLEGNDCAGRGTSCADQLTIALKRAVEAEAAGEAISEEAAFSFMSLFR